MEVKLYALPSAVSGNAERGYDSCDRHRWYSVAYTSDGALNVSCTDRFNVDNLLVMHGQEPRSVQEGPGRD